MACMSPADELFYGGQAGGGKMLDLQCPIPTPIGWQTIGNLKTGNIIFDEQGDFTTILIVHPIENNPESYLIIFDDGSEIKACANHQWLTFNAKELLALTVRTSEYRKRRRQKRLSRVTGNKSKLFTQMLCERNSKNPPPIKLAPKGTIRTTKEIFNTLYSGKRKNHAVPVAQPLNLSDIDLPIDPYIVGLWLGDGKTIQGKVYIADCDHEILLNIQNAGFKIRKVPSEKIGWTILGLQQKLKENGILGNKHIPSQYLRASKKQRLAFLQGLMDTDGTVNKSGSVEFTNTNKKIIEGIYELIVSLGWKARIIENRAKLYGKDCGAVYDIGWTPDEYVFRLTRKRNRQRLSIRRVTKFRYIKNCELIKSIPMRCLTVDSPSGLYLAGKSMIPTHNTDLLLGVASNFHTRSIIFRRIFPNLEGIIWRGNQIFGVNTFNGSLKRWVVEGRMIQLGAMQYEADKEKYRGRPHDFYAFDEICELLYSQYIFVTAWLRTTIPGQRCQIIGAGNPPTDQDGAWVIDYWAPWLDPKYPNPAKPGDIRWFINVNEKSIETPDEKPVEVEGEMYAPMSRTFIPAKIISFLKDTNYETRLRALPEPLRSQLLYGDFTKYQQDDEWQVIPTEWVLLAMDRWRHVGIPLTSEDGEVEVHAVPMTTCGVDVARGGKDKTILAPRFGNYVAKLIKIPGKQTPDGQAVAGEVMKVVKDKRTQVNIDIIGVGGSPYDYISDYGFNVVGLNSAVTSKAVDEKSGLLHFANLRAEMWWHAREMLDPDSGEDIALPDDREMLRDLTSARWKVTARGVQIEDKEIIKARIGRSPDAGEAVIYCLYDKVQVGIAG